MSEKRASNVQHIPSPPSPKRQQLVSTLSTSRKSVLSTIHPDDAKDKVFTAILKALLKKGNKPSSPKELANDIVKHKYATLGGATPFATVSSRISQHFKRAAQHNPPRTPLLVKHVDQHHSRKINYSLITPVDSASSFKLPSENECPLAQQSVPPVDLSSENHYADNDNLQPVTTTTIAATRQEKTLDLVLPQQQENYPDSDVPSEADYSDYYEDMMKGDETMAHIEISKRRSSSSVRQTAESPKLVTSTAATAAAGHKLSPNEFWSPYAFDQDCTNNPLFLPEQTTMTQLHPAPLNIVSPESISESELDLYFGGSGKAARTSRNSFSALSDEKEPFNVHPTVMMTGSDDDNDNDEVEKVLVRRKSWPLVGSSSSSSSSSTNLDFKDATSRVLEPSKGHSTTTITTTTTATTKEKQRQEILDLIQEEKIPIIKTYSENGHRFTITKKILGPLLCYELDSPNDIPGTKVLRFIASNDDSAVANRTRKATNQQQQQQQQPHSSLVEGYVNATMLRKAAVPVLGQGVFDAEAEMEQGRLVVTLTNGPLECRGTWVTLDRARELVDEFEIESSPGLTKLLCDHPMGSDRHEIELSSQQSTASSKLGSPSSDDEFVQFEQDEKIPPPSTIHRFDLTTLQQLMASIPGLSNTLPTPELTAAFTSYMQAVGKPTFDLKSTLARFQALDAIFKKDTGQSTITATTVTQSMPTSPTTTTTTTTSSPWPLLESNKIYPTIPTHPPMYITMIDHVPVCIATLGRPGESDTTTTYAILRRLDTGFVNGTSLLAAGGIDTDRERSMILSFEMERIRIPNKTSRLCGTWIPLYRAQELAATCSIQNRLTDFFSDHLETFFPPSFPSGQQQQRRRRQQPLGLQQQQQQQASSNGYDLGPLNATLLLQKKILSSTPLQQLLLSHPYKALTSEDGISLGVLKAPLLGNFDRPLDQSRQQRSITITNNNRHFSPLTKDDEQQQEQQQQPEEDDHSDATESDTDIKKVRLRMKRMRNAAIDTMETGQSMKELLSRASGPIIPFSIKRQRLYDIKEEEPINKNPSQFLPHGRRRRRQRRRRRRSPPPTTTANGLTTSIIKKSASWNGAISRPGMKRKHNLVMAHHPILSQDSLGGIIKDKVPELTAMKSEDDDDELIDIGGSNDDDDVR